MIDKLIAAVAGGVGEVRRKKHNSTTRPGEYCMPLCMRLHVDDKKNKTGRKGARCLPGFCLPPWTAIFPRLLSLYSPLGLRTLRTQTRTTSGAFPTALSISLSFLFLFGSLLGSRCLRGEENLLYPVWGRDEVGNKGRRCPTRRQKRL